MRLLSADRHSTAFRLLGKLSLTPLTPQDEGRTGSDKHKRHGRDAPRAERRYGSGGVDRDRSAHAEDRVGLADVIVQAGRGKRMRELAREKAEADDASSLTFNGLGTSARDRGEGPGPTNRPDTPEPPLECSYNQGPGERQ